ncbi:hypothetical protein LCGC14_2448340 [marine sediment metagenome]|uniref:HK97 gp10 family phage protein n=1 Tax=marine sediment metagenome TaxID=412755 RepID=A0A0F9DTZ2_9ZZZZ
MAKIVTGIKGVWYGEDIIDGMEFELQGAFFKSAERIATSAKSKVEYSTIPITNKHPGHLKDTIRARHARREKDMPGAFVFAGNRLKGIYWQWMVEYGTYDKPARAYMRPAINANFNATVAEAARAANREINRVRRETDKSRRFFSKFTLG